MRSHHAPRDERCVRQTGWVAHDDRHGGPNAALVTRIADGTVSNSAARQLFDALWLGDDTDVDALIESRGLRQLRDAGELERIVDEVIAANPKSVEEFRAGKEKAFNALVGQAMKATKGKGDPAQLNALFRDRLG